MTVPIPLGLTYFEATWTEPNAPGSVTVDKSHGQPKQLVQVGEKTDVSYTFKDASGNMIAECVFELVGVRGEQVLTYICKFRLKSEKHTLQGSLVMKVYPRGEAIY